MNLKLFKLAVVLTASLMMLIGCGGGSGGGSGKSSSNDNNFRLLVSDAPNAIGDFTSLYVRVSGIGLELDGEEDDEWIRLSVGATGGELVNLVPLVGAAATPIWSGTLPAGDYNEAFLYVTEAYGTLAAGGTVNVEVPGNKLEINLPFIVAEGEVTNFVYDITVVAKEGGGYMIKPELAESGDDIDFDEVENDDGDEERDEQELQLFLIGDPLLDPQVTLVVTDAGVPVAGATVEVEEEVVGTTNAQGELTLTLADEEEEVEIKATLGEKEGELEIERPEVEDDDDDEEWYLGTITAVTGTEGDMSPWTVTIEGIGTVQVIIADEVDGTPTVGALVQLEGTLDGATLTASEAEIKDQGDEED